MNFCFIIDSLLSASSQPGKNRRIKYYMDLYKENKIKALVSLHRKIEIPEEYVGKFEIYHFKWNDIINGAIEDLDDIVNIALDYINKKEAVNINCEGGTTNSAIMLAAILMKHRDISQNNAFQIISERRYAVEEHDTIELLENYQFFLDKKK